MILLLQQLPQLAGPSDKIYNGKTPKRALYMHPDAAAALLLVEGDTGGLVYTDIYRSPEAILRAYRVKPGITQPVGYSFHGYGGCVDIDVPATLGKLCMSYDQLLGIMAVRGFYCHRRDRDKSASESWHFNYVDNPSFFNQVTDDHKTWSKPAESMIQKWYGPELQLTDPQIETLLPVAHATDVVDFQRQWGLVTDGIAGPRTQRVLAFVTATKHIAMYQPNA